MAVTGASSGSALARREKGKVGRKRKAAEGAGQDQRRIEVARLLMERKNYREIVTALNDLPEGRRPASISVATVTRDVKVLREEWAAERVRDMDELVGEEVARLNELER